MLAQKLKVYILLHEQMKCKNLIIWHLTLDAKLCEKKRRQTNNDRTGKRSRKE